MKHRIHRAVVIGSGTMGAAIAAHLANAGIPATLLDIIPNELTEDEERRGLTLEDAAVRNRIVEAGLQRALKSRPASFFTREHAALIEVGNLEDDFDAVAKADWVIEAIIENLEIKQTLMARIDAVRQAHAIVSTNTSGIPVASIAEGRSAGFRQHFLGTHFFNPPRYLKLLELIPTPDTAPEVMDLVSDFAEQRLGKGVVICKDTPNFIANRIFSVAGSFTIDFALEHGYTVKEVDVITGPPMGRPKTATFRLADLVGLDVWQHVGGNLAPAIGHDTQAMQYLSSERMTGLLGSMVERGLLGNKVGQGFYKTVRQNGQREFYELDLKTLEYLPPSKPRFDSVGKARELESPIERLQVLLDADDKAGQLVRAMTYQGLAYASAVIPEIADTPLPIDDAIRWGFNHELGPFETWDALGVAETAERMEEAGYPPANWVGQMLAGGFDRFYQYQGEVRTGVYHPQKQGYERLEAPKRIISLHELKSAGKVVSQNTSATLVDLGEGVGCVEFHTKMNAIDDDIVDMLNEAFDRTEAGEFDALVIGNDGEHFSAGANIFVMVMGAQNGMWAELEAAVRRWQGTFRRMRYMPKPVVVAAVGYALGGGAEILLSAPRVVAAAELYTGLVEVGQGLMPAAGGVKEMLRRVLNPAMRTQNADDFPFLSRLFEQIGQAKVATSAEEARQFGILGPEAPVVMNRDHLLAEAKREALHLVRAGYRPPRPETIYAAGRDALAGLRVGIHMFKEGGYITEYEAHIGEKLSYVLTGGDLSLPAWLDEAYFLDLEREGFLSLLGEEKTQQRMWHFLQTGRPLRN